MAGSHRRFRLLLIAAVTALLGCGTTAAVTAQSWESGSFAKLPLAVGSDNLVTFVDSLTHDPSYTALSPDRESKVGVMFDAIQTATTAMTGGNPAPDWCAVVTAAGNAGYRLRRYYDSVSQRWFLFGADASGTGQAYFFINPEPRRDLIIEAPHVYASNSRLEGRTDTEGALLLRQTLGRALLINGADRCQGPQNSCGGTFSSDQVCTGYKTDDPYRKSDAGHNTDSAFHVLHKKFNDVSTSTRFAQLHGNTNTDLPNGGVSVSDSRNWLPEQAPFGLATAFVNALQTLSNGALPAASVNDCTNELKILCGYENAQGRSTNDPGALCGGSSLKVGGLRFLHLEQRSALIDSPQPVSDALQAVVPCNLSSTCSLPAQSLVSAPPNVCTELP